MNNVVIKKRERKSKNQINDIEAFENLYGINCKLYKSLVKLELSLIGEDNEHGIDDPIEYLHYLYYDKKLGAPSIFKIVGDFFHYKDYSKLNYLFREIFGWKQRTNGEKTNAINNQDCGKTINESRIKREKKNIEKMVNNILGGKKLSEINQTELSFETLEIIKFKKDKMLKILSIISGKKEEKIKNIILKTRDNKDNKTGATQIAKKIQEVLDNLGLTDIEINRHLIQKM